MNTPLIELANLIEKYEALAIEALEVLEHLKEWKRLEERNNAARPWSKVYSQCVKCGTKGHTRYQSHASRGRCNRCYTRDKQEEYRRAKGIGPRVWKNPPIVQTPEPIKEVVQKLDWDTKAIPVDCAWCFIVFESDDERVETEDEHGTRVDWHTDCYQEMMQH